MRVICSYSGVELWKTGSLLGFDLEDIHPIFRAKRKLILRPEWVHRFMKSENSEEKKLIFLAVLNATELLTFEVPAMPSPHIVEKYFHPAMHTACWLSYAEYTYKQIVGFPSFAVRKDTFDLATIGNWLKAIEDIKDGVIKKDIDRDRAAFLAAKEQEIRKEIGDATLLNRAFTPALARWSLDFAELKRVDERYNRYLKVLCTPLADSWVYEIDELRDIEELLELNLPAEHPQVISVMAQIRLLIKECKRGFQDFKVFDSEEDEVTRFEIIDEETQQVHAINRHLQDIPTDEPKSKDFPKRIDFLRAHSKWLLQKMKDPKPDVARKFIKPDRMIGEDDV